MGGGVPGHAQHCTQNHCTCLKAHIADHGTPAELLTDRGFLSEELRSYLRAMGIKHNCTAAYTPSTNGSVEGFHSYLATGLSALVNEQHSDWDEHIHPVLLAYRTAAIDGTGISPFEIVYGRPANLPLDNALSEARMWDEAAEDAETVEQYAAKVHKHAVSGGLRCWRPELGPGQDGTG